MPEFDAAQYKQTQHDQWNEDAAAWHRWTPTRQNWFADVSRTMLDLGRVKRGDRVLDIATGAGEPALSAAERVGASGYVLATDLSENIVGFARQVADQRGLRNFETRAMDGENPDLPDNSFDVVFCRFGLMYMPNRQRALSHWYRVLKPGGRVVVAAFTTPDKNAWGSVPVSIIGRHVQLPQSLPGQPGPFSLGAEGVMEGALHQVGFQSIEIRVISAPLRMKSAEEFVRYARETFGALNQMIAHLPQQKRESIWVEVAEAMKPLEDATGIEVSCEPLFGAGVKA